ncbi:MAG: DUF2784 domain-containing protein [Deltaproteobacteria bacterium]|nr:DUF2784 domain-containing protein [Candidatus Zymogenaceae bacterium]
MENILSDAVLVVHFGWILFIILGFPVSLLYTMIRLRLFHTAAMIFTIAMQATRTLCPLTLLEEALRRSTDAAFSYEGSFIITWLRKLIYIEDIGVSLTIIYILTAVYLAAVLISYPVYPVSAMKRSRTARNDIPPQSL